MSLKVKAFLNGDPTSKPVSIVIRKSTDLNQLMDLLTSRLKPNFGAVRRVYGLDGSVIHDIKSLSNGDVVIAAKKEAFKSTQYQIGNTPTPRSSGKAKVASHQKTLLVCQNGATKDPLKVLLPRPQMSLDALSKLLNSRLNLKPGTVSKLYDSHGVLIRDVEHLPDKSLVVAASFEEKFKPLPYQIWRKHSNSPTKGAPGGGQGSSRPTVKVQASIKTTKFGALEKRFTGILNDRSKLSVLWQSIDYNGNGLVSLAEVDKFVIEQFPLLDNKAALMRAFKKTTLRDGDGDSWVEKKEFVDLLRNILYFNKVLSVFDDLDQNDDDRLTFDEFRTGLKLLGLNLKRDEAQQVFRQMDVNGGGFVLFDEFCAWIAEQQCPVDGQVVREFTLASKQMKSSHGRAAQPSTDTVFEEDTDPDIHTAKFDQLETEMKEIFTNKRALVQLWRSIDYNGNGYVSLAEVDKFVQEQYPLLDNKPALMRAFKKTTLRDGDGDAYVEKHEFIHLLRNMLYFNKLFVVFAGMDKDGDRRIDFEEFSSNLRLLGLALKPKAARQAFAEMDKNDGGLVLFDEFCAWVAEKQCPVDDDVVKDFTLATKSTGKGVNIKRPSVFQQEEAERKEKAEKISFLEKQYLGMLNNPEALGKLWRRLDFNGNGLVSVAELDKFMVESFPVLDNKPALLRAYQATVTKKGGEDDDWVTKSTFAPLLRNIFYFNKLFNLFESVDENQDRRLSEQEVSQLCSSLRIDSRGVFKQIDRNGGGYVLFDEFCLWFAKQQVRLPDEA